MDKIQTWIRKPYEVAVIQYQEHLHTVIQEFLYGTGYRLTKTKHYGMVLEGQHKSEYYEFLRGKDHYLVKHGTKVKVLTLEQLEAEYELKV